MLLKISLYQSEALQNHKMKQLFNCKSFHIQSRNISFVCVCVCVFWFFFIVFLIEIIPEQVQTSA